MPPLTRRAFVRTTTLAAVAARLATDLRAAPPAGAPAAVAGSAPAPAGHAALHWLDGAPPAHADGATWGVPWARGKYPRETTFTLRTAEGAPVPVQSWPLATWPDGSLKWTAHAVPALGAPAPGYVLGPGTPAAPAVALRVEETPDGIVVDTGVVELHLARRGAVLVHRITREGREVARDGRIICLRREGGAGEPGPAEEFGGEITAVTVEHRGPVRAVVKFEGQHRRAGHAAGDWLPFVVRLECHAGSDAVRLFHTIIYAGDEHRDLIAGLGVRFGVPLRGELHDRHVRFAGEDEGLFAEAVRGLTGLRRDPGAAARAAQLAGEATPPTAQWSRQVSERLPYIPAFGDWTLFQANADGFSVRKRTAAGYTWLTSAQGRRAGGLGYVGTPAGGLAFGIRNFWEAHPGQLDIRGATGEVAEATAWVWAPAAGPMDLRPYHDGMGQDTYAKQYNGGLEITYEDYEPGFDKPEGVARTSELHFRALAATPSRAALVAMGAALRTPPRLMAAPDYLHACGVFGGLWTPADRSTPARAAIEERLDWQFEFYRQQQEQRRWYGYWNHGDVMHTYDADRHEWRYDVGGFAWDNSELSTDIWLWLHFLRTGRAEVFRFAEAMTRHTGEVDVHHVGRFAPLGSRHNVLHWGCSAKQLRISTAVNRRYYYYLTGDERVGELMREQLEAGRALLRIPPGRKLGAAAVQGDLDRGATTGAERLGLSLGTDWGSLAGAWLTEWERTGDPRMLGRLREGMRTIAAQPRGFFTVGSTINLDTGAFAATTDRRIGISHLNAVFGLPEVCAELIELIDVPEFRRAWLDYCELYNASADEQVRRLGEPLRGTNLQQGHSRLTAYAARLLGDPALAARAWAEFRRGEGRRGAEASPQTRRIAGAAVPRPVDEAAGISTNGAAQWGLAAIQCLALVGDALPPE